jgi:hypothetical protein
MAIRLVNDGLALMSMRDSDFDADSAFGEIVDNSIQARAKTVSIQFDTKPTTAKSAYEYVTQVAFGDDGDGMNADTVQRCLQLGYSSRYNDRSGIGRFGVGMTLAAIHECKRVEVYSKQQGGPWLWTYADLDEIVADPDNAAIPEPTERPLPVQLQKLAGKESGTVVVWKKYDRQPDSASKMRTQMHEWMGRTFRHFIWDGLSILIDGEPVRVIDPLYVRWDKSRFPDDPPGQETIPIEMAWPVPEELRKAHGKDESIIRIRLSLSHPSNWPHQGSGNRKEAKERFFGHNEGISILRNRREVFYDHVPHWPGGAGWFVEKDRWWGCEVSFDPVLDRAFSVKNIKRGAVPNAELKKAIFEVIAPTIKTYREQVDELWMKAKKAKPAPGPVVPVSGHEDAEGAAGKTPTDKSALDAGKDVDAEATKLVDALKADADAAAKAAWVAKFKSQPFTIIDDRWKGPQFLEVNHLGGSDVLRYNREHAFFVEVYSLLDRVDLGSSGTDETRRLKALLDLLLIAYAKAEAKFDAKMVFNAEDFVENLRLSWGQYLQSYVRTWLRESSDEG